MIWEELNPELIFTELEAETSDDVMKMIGTEFTRLEYTKDSYVEALIAREAEFPTGLDVEMENLGVAIPHTSVEHVNRTGTAIAVLKNPVTFNVMGGDEDETVQVGLVFMLAVVDPNKHIDKLQRIIALIQDQELLKKLAQAKTKDEIIALVKDKESEL
ncbi:MAG: PTS sugar transporter subunit IIA [Lachnospiraceae bacterium]|nr:PTS sugar transporter subunit IIA [Lachnospiraceae bacterium]